jgi:predicted nucleotidyltransferase
MELLGKISTQRQQDALEYAIKMIEQSPVKKYISSIWLFGSCARDTQKFDSDVDLLVELDVTEDEFEEIRYNAIILRGEVSPLEASAPEVDIKYTFKGSWEHKNTTFYNEVRKDGMLLWK